MSACSCSPTSTFAVAVAVPPWPSDTVNVQLSGPWKWFGGVYVPAPAPASHATAPPAVEAAATEGTVSDGVGRGTEVHVQTPSYVAHGLRVDGELVYCNAFAS